ncbi:ankyrin-2-like [Archocentrus centrarchus]|uniref:ankyrin-2-like n=1 Tax=Archocentrus centrarchus TaxID=63155 RepID=UPI0011E9CB94|nr:ankyrin-2-like [Archocentrus centrarchus]
MREKVWLAESSSLAHREQNSLAGQQTSTASAPAATKVKTEKCGDSGLGTTGDQLSTEMTLLVSSSEATNESSHSTTPTKEKREPFKEPIEFFEEISDEAAKLVARLAHAETDKEREVAAAISDDESSLTDPSIIEREHFPEMQFPPSGDIFPIRPLWDEPVETQMQRIPDDKVQSQGIPPV